MFMESKKSKAVWPVVERDLSWMYFNRRILQEAEKEGVPVMERMSFLGIYSNNLDEFFRVRVASLSRIAEAKEKVTKAERDRAKNTIKDINRLNADYNREFERAVDGVTKELESHGIRLLHETELNDEQKRYIYKLYADRLNGCTNPIWLKEIKEIGYTDDDGIYLAVRQLRWREGRKKPAVGYALIKVPDREVGRFVRLPPTDGFANIMYLDDVIRLCLPYIFIGGGACTYEAYSFKFTKDAEMDIDNDLDHGVMQKVAKGVKSRKRGEPIRVIYDERMPKDLLRKVMARLNVDQLDTIVSGGRYQNHKDLMAFPDCGKTELHYPLWPPIAKAELEAADSVMEAVRQRDRFLHVPYHSFNGFIRLLREAALSPDVREIRATLYRLARDSKVVNTLICAARNGKKVTVVIELLARFDEESNINWSKRMQESGIEVVFGVEGLKVHSKLVYIGARGGDIACVGTGNFHEGNAKLYTDYMLMTAKPTLASEVKKVFDFIRKPFKPVRFRELLVSPNDMKPRIMRLIDNETRNARAGREAWMKLKINHITDADVVAKLYEAAEAGVKIDILLRGNCSLVPSESPNMHVVGIIDRYLEHSRILVFANGGAPKYYIGSADWMPRNLLNRVEVLTPVGDERMQADLMRTIDYGLRDTTNGRIVDGHGLNALQEGEPFRSQERLYADYVAEAAQDAAAIGLTK